MSDPPRDESGQALLFAVDHYARQVRPVRPSADPIPPVAPGSDVSLIAAQSIRGRGRGLRELVLITIRQAGHAGMTDEELSSRLGLRLQTVGPRRFELMKAGKVWDSGRRRPTTSGRPATVWIGR